LRPLGLCALFLLLAVSAWWNKSNTYDELAHLTAGHAYSRYGAYNLNPENGMLPQRLAALPSVIAGAPFPAADSEVVSGGLVWGAGLQFFYDLGNDPNVLLRWGRGVIALLGAGLGLLVFLWSRKLHGPRGAFFSLALYAFSPTMLGQCQITSDLAAAAGFTFALWALDRLLARIDLQNGCLLALALSCLALAKFSAAIFAPVALLLVLNRSWQRNPLPCGARTLHGRGQRLLAFLAVGLAATSVVIAAIWRTSAA
jgi:hypothetical protein